jgi:prevent-host-death family protein
MDSEQDRVVSINRLGRNATDVIRRVEEEGDPALITRHGAPAAYIVSLADASKLGLTPERDDTEAKSGGC